MESQTPPSQTGLILVDDLMFASQVQGLARSAGVHLQWVRNAVQALEQCQASGPACIILDVNLIGAGIAELVASFKAMGEPAPILIGFGSHVDAASLHRARDAGCDLVMPRSQLVQDLSGKLSGWIARRASER
jgi:FixJ family two-component response regulator